MGESDSTASAGSDRTGGLTLGEHGEPESGGAIEPQTRSNPKGVSKLKHWVKKHLSVQGDDFRTQPTAAAPAPQPGPNPPAPPKQKSGFLRSLINLLCIPFHPEARRAVLVTVLKFRAPAISALLMCLFLAVPEQTREIYVKLAEDHVLAAALTAQERIVGQADFFAIFADIINNWDLYSNFIYVLIVCFGVWACGRWIGYRTIENHHKDPFVANAQDLTVVWMPRLLGIIPLLGLFWGTSSTSQSYAGTTVSRELAALADASSKVTTLYVIFIMVWNRYGRPLLNVFSSSKALAGLGDPAARIVDSFITYFAPLPFLYIAYVFASEGTEFAVSRGPIIILCGFAYAVMFVLTSLYFLSRRIRWPWTGTLIALVLLQSCTGWSDNDQLSQSATSEKADFLPKPTQVYRSWRSLNPDGAPIVIAAQGGGLYAAYHAAMVLARLHDAGPELGARVLAVSGVSGGAVGTAVFNVIHRSGVCKKVGDGSAVRDCYTDTVRDVLRRDFLSPVLGSMLFPDLLTRIVPNVDGWTEGLSRARRLEDAFDDALRDVLSRKHGVSSQKIEELLDTPVLSHSYSDGPLLLLNATDVDTGERMVMTPLRTFDNNNTGRSSPSTFAEVTACSSGSPCTGPDVLAAGIVSARFPYVTPAATLAVHDWEDGTTKRIPSTARYADGGYFDNSGVETARDFIRGIEMPKDDSSKPRQFIELIAMAFPPRRPRPQDRSTSFDELAAPVRTLASARGARGELAKRRAYAESGGRFRYSTLRLDDTTRSFTLGWTLSGLTFDRIECHLWNDGACERIRRISGNITRDNDAEETKIQKWNRCVLRELQKGRQVAGEAEICDSKGSSGRF